MAYCNFIIIIIIAYYNIIIINLRQPGVEPGPPRWQRGILTVELLALIYFLL